MKPLTKKQLNPRKKARQSRSKATVESLLSAATRILCHEGIQKFNTNYVAEVAGVSIGSLYQYYPSKEAMLAGILERYFEEEEAVLTEAFLELEATFFHESLLQILQTLYQKRKEQRVMLELLEWQLPRENSYQQKKGIKQKLGKIAKVKLSENFPGHPVLKNPMLVSMAIEMADSTITTLVLEKYPQKAIKLLHQSILDLLGLSKTSLTP